jgi:hypothetical protein
MLELIILSDVVQFSKQVLGLAKVGLQIGVSIVNLVVALGVAGC